MKKIALLLLHFIIVISLVAQDKNDKIYKERSIEVKGEIFGEKNAAFDVNITAPEFKDESAIIIARSIFYSQDKKNKIKLTLFGPSFGHSRNNYITTIREKVKLNDQAALDEYATLEYKKEIDKTTSYGLFSKSLDKAFTFIGVNIIKPDGKVIEQNMDEEVLTKDEKKKKEGKLAISGLQIGDILDYYIRIEEIQDDTEKLLGPYFFVMGGEHPIMDLQVKFIIDKNAGIAYRAANGAPEFKQTTTEKDDYEFNLHQNNLPKITKRMWQMPYKQLPYIVISYKTNGGYKKPYIKGTITKQVTQEDYLKEIEPILDILVKNKETPYEITNTVSRFKDLMQTSLNGKLKTFTADSLAITLFYIWQHHWGYSFLNNGFPTTQTKPLTCEVNDYSLYNFYVLLALHKFMQIWDIDNELVVVTPVGSPKTDDILSYGDYDLLLRTKSSKPIYFTMDNRFFSPYELPARYQGQAATVLDIDLKKSFFGKSNTYNRTPTKLPVSTATDNSTIETFNVSFDKNNMAITTVDRTVATSGYYRPANEMNLCLPEETQKRNAKLLGIDDAVNSMTAISKRLKETAANLQKIYDEGRTKWKDYFKDEIQEQYGIEPKEVLSYDITNYALRYWEKYFTFKQKFTMEGWTKKAGNNYLFEVGKLIGIYTRIEEKERDRKMDIYMPCARSFEFAINITVPDGFMAKGIEFLNKNITNESGMFTAIATVNGNNITIAAKRQFNNGFEPASKWKNLLDIMDACTEFTTQKILFEKAK